MKSKYLKIIAIVLIGIGAILTSQMLYDIYQMELITPSEFSITVIGAIISVSWYFPFFIIGFILLRKSKKKKINIKK